MLNIEKTQSTNEITMVGTLSEIEIQERTTSDGRDYITCSASIKVDQDIFGNMVENVIPIRSFSMRLKRDGNPNSVYTNIKKWGEDFISLAAAENPAQATKIKINTGRLEENNWVDKNSGEVRTGFQISTNFMNRASLDDEEQATFELSGVVANMSDEVDKNGDETGRLLIRFITVGYLGKVEVFTLIADGPRAEYIRNNWEKGDTVTVTGYVNVCQRTVSWEEPQGFGKPKKRTRTENKRELIIDGGSECGLDEDSSYDSTDIKMALEQRTARLEAMKTTAASKPAAKPSTKKSQDFGF